MKYPFQRISPLRYGLGLALALTSGAVLATLGRHPWTAPAPSASSPPARQLASSANKQSSLYTRHTYVLDNGTTVWEFATPEGVVFGVKWQGPVLPDLSRLLGEHFQTFHRETAQARVSGRHGSPVNIERGDFVLRSLGRMRNFFGHAYAPNLVPSGVEMRDVLQ